MANGKDWAERFSGAFRGKKLTPEEKSRRAAERVEERTKRYGEMSDKEKRASRYKEISKKRKESEIKFDDGGVVVMQKKKITGKDAEKLKDSFESIKKIIKGSK